MVEMKVLRIGHRGAMGYEPENTLLSFSKALELGCDMIELDVQLCRTGELVVIHDNTLDRTTNGKGRIMDAGWDTIRNLYAGKGQRIPLLQEALDLTQGKAQVNIELKGLGTAQPVAAAINACLREKGWRREDLLVSSFDPDKIEAFRKYDAETPVGILFRRIPYDLPGLARRLKASSLHPRFKYVSRDLMSFARNAGMKVFAWTVDRPDAIARMKLSGVDGIISNFPDRI